MTYIRPGDLLITRTGAKFIAASPDYIRTLGSGNDVESFAAINVIGSDTGKLGWLRLSDVTDVSKKDR